MRVTKDITANDIEIRAAHADELLQIAGMSADWEKENSCYGFRADEIEYLQTMDCLLAFLDGTAVGYAFGSVETAKNMRSILSDGTPFFELEELYVRPENRNFGIGRLLFCAMETHARTVGCQTLLLSTATKDCQSILRFYLTQQRMQFWSARLFKRL